MATKAVCDNDMHRLLSSRIVKSSMLDVRVYMRSSLTLVGAVGMMVAAYLNGSAQTYDQYGNLFAVSGLIFIIGLAFSISSHYYWLRGVKEEIERM